MKNKQKNTCSRYAFVEVSEIRALTRKSNFNLCYCESNRTFK